MTSKCCQIEEKHIVLANVNSFQKPFNRHIFIVGDPN